MPVTPAIPHNDLKVVHSVHDATFENDLGGKAAYLASLHTPEGKKTAPNIVFHKGSPEKAWHGWTTAKVIEALIVHMEYHQTTPFACDENREILSHLKAAHEATKKRATERKDRGVLYDHRTP